MFRSLKSGDILHILEMEAATGIPRYKVGTVIDAKLSPKQQSYSAIQESQLVDVTVDVDNATKEFLNVVADKTYAIAGKFRLSTDKQKIIDDIKGIKSSNEQLLSSVDKYQNVIDGCNEALQNIGESEHSNKVEMLEKEVNNIKSDLKEVLSILKKMKS